MVFELRVCFRETRLHAALDRLACPWQRRNLRVADVHIVQHTDRGWIPRILIELKTPEDLAASITDGRLRDERQRMLEFAADLVENHGVPSVTCVVYIVGWIPQLVEAFRKLLPGGRPVDIEVSSHDVTVNQHKVSTLRSAQDRMMFRDGIYIREAPTYTILAEDLERLVTHNAPLIDQSPKQTTEEYEHARRLKHGTRRGSRDVTPASTMVAMLQQIKGFSAKRAQCVRDTFHGSTLTLAKKICERQSALEDAPSQAARQRELAFLADIELPGQRRLGNVLADRLVVHFGVAELEVHVHKKRRKEK